MTTRTQMSKAAEYQGGHTELMRAALEGRTEAVKTLLEGGADPNEKDDEGRTALMFAVTNIQTAQDRRAFHWHTSLPKLAGASHWSKRSISGAPA